MNRSLEAAPTRFIVIRHGRSKANEQERIAGIWNVSLTEQGEREAREAGKKLELFAPFDNVYTSNLHRAIRTAELVTVDAPDQKPLIITDLLRERNFGDWEKKKVKRTKVVDFLTTSYAERRNLEIVPRIEIDERMIDRWGQFFDEISEESYGKTNLVSTHSSMMATYLDHQSNKEEGAGIKFIKNAAYFVLETYKEPQHQEFNIIATEGIIFQAAA